ncbi:MAG TPA: HAD-IC family P-type ATPase [Streptosporangiaceae bacterium]|nr:HAD-IC family P-type ATPase [Streptosporangiaceae bacterium]
MASVIGQAGTVLSAIAGKLPISPGRRLRRRWAGNGRAHIEVKGIHRPENHPVAGHLEAALAVLDGVEWAEVNTVAGRVVVAFDGDRIDVDTIVDVIDGVENAHDLADERFPHERPDHPADREPIQRQMYAMAADVGGLMLGLAGKAVFGQFGRVARRNPLVGEVASLLSLADSTPVLRHAIEGRLGRAATDLGLAVGNAVSQGLAQGPAGLLVDIAHRGLLVDELRSRQDLWRRREPELHGRPAGQPPAVSPSAVSRPVPLPSGPVETYAARAAAAALIGAAGVLAATRNPHLMVAATATAAPKAAKLCREGFAARFGRDLARAGVLVMDTEALRRLDRVDAVLLDTELLAGGQQLSGTVWVPNGSETDAESARLVVHALLSARRVAPGQPAGWALRRVPRAVPGDFGTAARDLRGHGRVRALFRGRELTGLVAIEPELDPLAAPLVTAARSVGLVAAGGQARLGGRVPVDRVMAGGARMASAVRILQAEGHVVALVSGRHPEALAVADLGIGVPAGAQPPWGADLITGPGLAGACRVVQAIPPARAVSRRGAVLSGYGSGAGAVVAMAGPRAGAATRSLLAVNAAALAALASGFWSAVTLARTPPPLPADATGWHALEAAAVLARLGTSDAGLDKAEAGRRRAGLPSQAGRREPGLVRASLEELDNPLTPALASGAGLAAVAGSVTDAALIATFMAANALVSGAQRVSVWHALRRLIDESAVRVRLRRGSGEELGTAADLVPGDVVMVQAGDAVPADCRILTARGLEADESSLTGESQLVAKGPAPTGAASLAERRSMLYAGSSVAAGEASAAVVAVGPATELGRSTLAGGAQRPAVGVQARLRELTRMTIPVTLGAGAALVGGGLLRGRPLRETLGTGVSLAVAAVPEGLPIVATAAQYSAARRLSRRNALVRNPGTIEALGRVDVLCFDKTGTLTEGRIRLHGVWAAGSSAGSARRIDALPDDERLVLAAALRATPVHGDTGAFAHPTDEAVAVGADAAGIGVELGAEHWRPSGELPFEPSRGYHAVLGRTRSGQRLCVKGAPEVVLPLCSSSRAGRAIEREADDLARAGYRVLAVAERDASGHRDLREDRIARLRFCGLLAFADPVRGTAAAAVRALRTAKVDVLMLTGDHPSTAEAIAAELGLLNGRVVTGPELDDLADSQLDRLVTSAAVFARVSPDHKVRIVASLRRVGRVVAVTGDGANDAPAIRLADVGVALGRRGTNAAKEAADIVVTDDQIETIVDAIVEGRAMWSSVRDAIALLLGGNLGEIAFTLGAGLLPGGQVLNARQLLLVNMLTDMVPSLVLAMRQPQSATPEALLREGPDVSLGSALNRDIMVRGGLTAAAGLAAWAGGRMTGVMPRRASTTALVGVVGAQLGQTLVAGWRSPMVVAASAGSAVVLAGVIQTPGLSQFFGCTPLGPVGWASGVGPAVAASVGAPLVGRLLPPLPAGLGAGEEQSQAQRPARRPGRARA